MRAFFAAVLLAVIAACMLPPAEAARRQAERLPNVLVITIDTLRADRLGCYGYRDIRTPHIDALATAGVLFEKAYSPVPITLPSHAVMFTGTFPMLNGMHDFGGNRLNPKQPTLASVLRSKGYATGAVVAAAVLEKHFGLDSGFDFYSADFPIDLAESQAHTTERPANQVVDRGLAWLRENTSKRFFLWLHLYDPHWPYEPPPPYAEQYKDKPYDGEIAFTDEQVGRVIDFLKQRRLYDNTIVVLLADHGEALGEHGESTHAFLIYNSTLHVPLIIKPAGLRRFPARILPAVSTVDLMPTVLDLLGIAKPAVVQGRSLVSLMSGKKGATATEIYSETFVPRLHFNWSELRAVQAGRYRYIQAPRPELYDLEKDPGETSNLYSSRKALAQETKARLEAVIRKYTPGEELAQKTSLDPAMAARLQALGYAAFSGGEATPKLRGSADQHVDPKDRIQVYELVRHGLNASQRGRLDESIAKLQEALKIDANSAPVHYALGLNFYRKKDFAAAIPAFRRALEISPNYLLAVSNLGLAYAQSGEMDKAIPLLERALRMDPSISAAAFNLGTAYMRQNRVPEALEAFRKSVAAQPSFGPGHLAVGETLLYMGRVDEAIPELQEAARLLPHQPRVQRALQRAQRAKEAAQQQEKP